MAAIAETKLSRAALQARIDALPRVRLAHLPTPLEHCPRLGAALGGVDVWIKRDDLTGLAFGGNKTRQLEFLFADILAAGAGHRWSPAPTPSPTGAVRSPARRASSASRWRWSCCTASGARRCRATSCSTG